MHNHNSSMLTTTPLHNMAQLSSTTGHSHRHSGGIEVLDGIPTDTAYMRQTWGQQIEKTAATQNNFHVQRLCHTHLSNTYSTFTLPTVGRLRGSTPPGKTGVHTTRNCSPKPYECMPHKLGRWVSTAKNGGLKTIDNVLWGLGSNP